jgi:hypothetical protein
MVFAASLFLIAVATLMFLGWGWAFLKVLRLDRGTWPLTAALGMAAVIFAGGILNLARLAYPSALAALAAIGLLLAIFALRDGLSIDPPPLIVATLIAIVLVFTIATQLPPSVYNYHDDYQKYFAYPVRMVETGTVFGSPLSAMGLQTLGAQAFLDGFVVAFFPIVYINGVDAVFGLLLCLLLAGQFNPKQKNLLAMTVVAVLSVVFINPQSVNISTLFCGSALIMSMAAVDDPASLGLLYAALIAMKPIYAVFIAIHLLSISLIAGRGIRWSLRTALAAAIFLAPWALVHAPNYLAALRTSHPAPTPVPGDIDTEKLNLFSIQPLAYGSTAANYTALAIAIAICGFICWRVKPSSMKTVACSVAAVVTLLVFVYLLGPIEYGYQHGLRYYTTVAIGLAPPIFSSTAQAADRLHCRLQRVWLPLIVAIVPLAAFGSSLRARIGTAVSTHSSSSYSWLAKDADYLEYNRQVLTGSERKDVKTLQSLVPRGETILAWMNTPFYLDYRRNPIVDIDTAGLGVPWAAVPQAKYLMWDYAGFATADEDDYEGRALNAGAGERKDSMITLDFIRRLNSMVEKSKTIYDDGKIKLIRLF